MATKTFRLALVQMRVTGFKDQNITRACEFIEKAAAQGANIVCLPECFNSPYGTKFFSDYAEPVPTGKTCLALSQAAAANKVWLFGGSIPERDPDGRLYNCATVWNPAGEFVTKFRKIHLFDINVPGKIRFQESETLTAGDSFCLVDTDFCKVGVGICYDLRFPELSRLYAIDKAQLLLFPGAFNMTTGPVHWELLQRARAVDNELFVATCSPARDEKSDYHAWGHSMAISPWGEKLGEAGHEEELVIVDCDLSLLATCRVNIPVWDQQRTDLYEVRKVEKK